MSITRIIGGKLTKTAIGNIDIHATNGNVHLAATTHNNWHGEENGIFYHDYEPSHPADSLATSIDVTLNIFFDGTQNNKTNTLEGKFYKKSNQKDDSYTNDFTNVARGYDTIDADAPFNINVYIEGISTHDLESDDIFPDVALGMGDRGVKAKVVKACVEAGKKILKYKGKEIDELIVNVFGFSRGAAAARHFLHVANSNATIFSRDDNNNAIIIAPHAYQGMTSGDLKINIKYQNIVDKHGYFAACLLKNNINPKKIKFNFVGLYDTVASYGLYHGNDVADLHLDAIKKAHFVFQLSADDEYRENFDLTDITSAGLNGLEYTLPGVHCDIGGAYKDMEDETSVLYYKRESIYNLMIHSTDQEVQKFREIVIKDGWYKPHQITAGVSHDSDLDDEVAKGSVEDSETFYTVVGIRKELRNIYDKIPLKKMLYYSNQFGVKYNTIIIEKSHEINEPFLQQVYNQLLNYMVACNDLRNKYVREKSADSQSYLNELRQISYLDYIKEEDLKTLRNEYLHWSVKANKFGLDTRESQAPTKEGALEQKYRKREIHHG
ncbi:phospholipase effector Tle1 domain-containing protein [Flavobacterium sp. 2]|uniref:phospholipase effector Tle1 domain-containing protein n=1 Tax=Flavobacterium sp. 2 TaxID=308053 RepID=UPI003CEDC25A